MAFDFADLGKPLRLEVGGVREHVTAGDVAAADAVCAQRLELASRDPRLQQAIAALREKRFAEADDLLYQHLEEDPTDVLAMQLLAAVYLCLEQFDNAVTLLTRCLELAPNFAAAHHDYALVLNKQGRRGDAAREIELALDAVEGRQPLVLGGESDADPGAGAAR